MKKTSISLLVTAVYAAVVYYVASPALSIHAGGFWALLISTLAVFTLLEAMGVSIQRRKTSIPLQLSSLLILISLAVFLLGALVGTRLFQAGRYASLAEKRIEYRDFLTDIPEEKSISNIALMDTDSAQIIGNRQMGSLSDLVSQFETSDYSTITLNGRPMKVSALRYVSFFRYLRNRRDGVPGYIQVNPVTQKAEYVKLDKGMKYVPSASFGHDLKRHIHSKYPGAIIGDFYFELDEDKKPYYVCPYVVYHAGLFGAKDVGGVILVDPVTGEMEKYALADVPQWVDRVYDGDLLCQQYDDYGKLKNGLWNSLFAKVGCVVTTADYGYKALEDDLWVFTGVTSVASDESNIGFVLMNSRTGAIRYYDISGAEEYSAMSAAEGQVQNLRYTAAFPSVINVGGEPVYLMVLKDSGGLTKMYALVNVQDYSLVATGVTQEEALKKYRSLLSAEGQLNLTQARSITVQAVRDAVMDGESYVYLIADGVAYRLRLSDDEQAVLIQAGDTVNLLIADGDEPVLQAQLDD